MSSAWCRAGTPHDLHDELKRTSEASFVLRIFR